MGCGEEMHIQLGVLNAAALFSEDLTYPIFSNH